MPRSPPLTGPRNSPNKPGSVSSGCSPDRSVSFPLLLDEMLSGNIADELRAKGHDVPAVVTDPALLALPDDQILAHATATGRALVTANIKDFMPIDAQYRAAGQTHAGLIFVSSETFRQDRSYIAVITGALAAFLDQDPGMQFGQVVFLSRR